MRAAIYARFSSDLQNERSIDDQIALCRRYADREGLSVTATFEDRALSGMSIIGRQGLAAMMEAAKAGAFKVIIVEALDRLARDSEDLAHIYKRLTFNGVEIRGVHDGRADAVQIGVRGLLGSLYVADLAHKVRRGFAGRAREGKHPSGKAYGYTVPAGQRGERQIVPAEAETVRRIYADYLAGHTPRTIAGALNREGVPPPRGATWNASTINGSRTRRNGILHNELYIGELVWNRLRMVKDPDTGRRVSRLNPESEWIRAAVPALAIIDRSTWEAVQARTAGRQRGVMQDGRRPRYLLSGLLRCASCGSGMAAHGADKTGRRRVHCSRFAESGSCSHRRIYYTDAIEAAVLTMLKDELRQPTVIAAYVEAYQAERRRLAADAGRERGRMETRLADIRRTLGRMVDQIVEGGATVRALQARMVDLEAEADTLSERLATAGKPADVITLHPVALQRFQGQVEQLASILSSQRDAAVQPGSSGEAVRALLDAVIVHPVPPQHPLDIEIRGKLAALIGATGVVPVSPRTPGSGWGTAGSSGRI